MSDRAAAALATGLLRDVGLVTDTDTQMVVDRYSIRRRRCKIRLERVRERHGEVMGLRCLGFDGKRDKGTKVEKQVEVNGSVVTRYGTKTEEHVVFVEDPGGKYVDHIVVEEGEGTGRHLGLAAADVIRELQSVDKLEAVQCDGTNVNTGWKSGAVAELERNIQKPVQWLVCLKHSNELPMRHVFNKLDGGYGTSGPESFKGPIGKDLSGDIHLDPVSTFEKIESNLPDLPEPVLADMSRDFVLLYRYSRAVSEGSVSDDLASQKPGPLNHARWGTLALRVLIHYTRSTNPPDQLVEMVKFIVQVYSVTLFNTSYKSKFTSGAPLLFEMMNLIKTQSEEVQQIAKPVVQNNAYFAHPENVLAAMLADEDEEVRRDAVNKILALRKMKNEPKKSKMIRGIRVFKVPKLNWDASKYIEIFDWTTTNITEPPVTKSFSEDDLLTAFEAPLLFPDYSLHTQAVERAVKLVSEASKVVYGPEARHKLILSRIKAREIRPAYDTKKDYVVNV